MAKYQNSSDLNAALKQAVDRRKEQEKKFVDPKERWKAGLAANRLKRKKIAAVMLIPIMFLSFAYGAWALGLRFGKPSALKEALASPDTTTTLSLNTCKLGEYPDEIVALKALQVLELDNNGLMTLPVSIGEFKKLKKLSLKYNALTSLPKELSHLETLVSLDLKANKHSSLPEEVASLKALQILDLTNNQIRELPKNIGDLKSLQELRLRGNQLSNLPKSLSKLRSLKILELTGNPVSELPPPSSFPELRRLSVGKTNISDATIESYKKAKVSVTN